MFAAGHQAVALIVSCILNAERVPVFVAVRQFHRGLRAAVGHVVQADGDELLVPRGDQDAHRCVIPPAHNATVHRIRGHPAEHAAVRCEFLLHVIRRATSGLCEGDTPQGRIG